MPDSSQISNAQTLVINAEKFAFETVEQVNGMATVVRFQLNNNQVNAGDVLLILAGSEIQFHGLIGMIEGGWATAADRRGSLLPAAVQ